MRILFDFECSKGHKFEALVNSDINTTECRTCGEPATKQISPVRCTLDPLSGHFPGETAKWAKMRQKKIAEERKEASNHGEPKWGN